ncbi:MAG: RimK/LysX family protein [Opitutales bacterium]|nr:RimK/LysX family protein [Opitutales bacterium]
MQLRFTSALLILTILSGCETIPTGQEPSAKEQAISADTGKTGETPKDDTLTPAPQPAEEPSVKDAEMPSGPVAPENTDPKTAPGKADVPQPEPSTNPAPVTPEASPQSEAEADDGDENIEAPLSDDPVAPKHPEKVTAGWVEWVCFQPETIQLKAKVDTGARTSSLHAYDLIEFERDGKKWVRFHVEHQKSGELLEIERPVVRYLKVIQHEDEPQKRPVVEMEIRMGPFHEKAEFTLIDRSNFVYQVLVGRNFLKGLVLVDCEETFLLGKPCGKLK